MTPHPLLFGVRPFQPTGILTETPDSAVQYYISKSFQNVYATWERERKLYQGYWWYTGDVQARA